MRNGYNPAPRAIFVPVLLLTAATLLAAGGCAGKGTRAAQKPLTPPGARTPQLILDEGFRALENQQFNEAIARADEFLAGRQFAAGTPEALYLKGRALEARNAAGVSEEEARANLQAARTAYIEALGYNPPQPLAAYLRTSLGNVAYFQDDYRTAIAQLTAAYDNLQQEDLKAWTLYRTGLSQQRLGQFEQADQTFAAVQQRFPNTIPAQRARERQGARAFYVQLATFAQPATADRAVAELKAQGVSSAQRIAGPEGRAYLRVGPIASYGQAQYLKNRFAEKYPDAIIIP